MKNILITGVNSYIGNGFEEWISQRPEKYSVNKISLRSQDWVNQDWSMYDVILHVAGIAHKTVKQTDEDIYFKVNSELTYRIGKKAKSAGVKHFIFISTMSVYGKQVGEINYKTPINPTNAYGQSKLKGEEHLNGLSDEEFVLSIIRPPMVYGKEAPGNYKKLSKLAQLTPVFPSIENKRSMIYIENLSQFIEVVIAKESQGVHCPQNNEYVNVKEMVKIISEAHSHTILFTKLFNPILRKIKNKTLNKIIGDLYYSKQMSFNKDNEFDFIQFKETIYLSEK